MDSVKHFQTLARYKAWATQMLLHTLPFATTLAHVVNHGTHRRGQLAPELDMVYMLQAENQPNA